MKKGKILCLLVAVAMVISVIYFSTNTKPIAATVDSNNDDWLHCRGNKIYDMYGNEVWLTGANWFGFNCSENCFHGAWYDVKDILSDIADRVLVS